ncbi:hypothetical protein MTO96_005350 [Rhipicephalus appendiculatus]
MRFRRLEMVIGSKHIKKEPRAPRQGGAVFFLPEARRLVFFARASSLILASPPRHSAQPPQRCRAPYAVQTEQRTVSHSRGGPGIDFPTLLFSTATSARLPPERMRTSPAPRGGCCPETGARSSQLLLPLPFSATSLSSSDPLLGCGMRERLLALRPACARDERLAAVRARHVRALRDEQKGGRRGRLVLPLAVLPHTMNAVRNAPREKFV